VSESTDVRMARMEEQLKTILKSLEKAEKDRDKSADRLEAEAEVTTKGLNEINNQYRSLDARLAKLENKVNDNQPTIEEFITIKHQVKGASKLGTFIYGAIGVVVGFLLALKTEIFSLFIK